MALQLSNSEVVEGILKGNRMVLSRAITLVESTLEEDMQRAQGIIERILPHTGNSIRVGITGVPGVGKSTFIEATGLHVLEQGNNQLAVLTIDPSSTISKGSILGDKTRMEQLSIHPGAFIRPSPTAGSLGGVARKTRDTILLCEAAGFNTIFIETVGVGQSEIAVAGMVDFFLLLMLSGAGDELQGMKKGIMEMADAVVINKADGDNVDAAKRAAAEYKRALHLFPPKESSWIARVATCSALTGNGIETVWKIIADYRNEMQESGYYDAHRSQQEKNRIREIIGEALMNRFYLHTKVKQLLPQLEAQVVNGEITAYRAATLLLEQAMLP